MHAEEMSHICYCLFIVFISFYSCHVQYFIKDRLIHSSWCKRLKLSHQGEQILMLRFSRLILIILWQCFLGNSTAGSKDKGILNNLGCLDPYVTTFFSHVNTYHRPIRSYFEIFRRVKRGGPLSRSCSLWWSICLSANATIISRWMDLFHPGK